MTIKTWFLNKNYNQSERYAINTTEPSIERETEKAYLLKFDTDFGVISGWFPKSVCEDKEVIVKTTSDVKEIKAGMKVKNPAGEIFTIVHMSAGGYIATADNGNEYSTAKLEIVE